MKKFLSILATSLVLLIATSNASATLITGTIEFTGNSSYTLNDDGDQVTSIDFTGIGSVDNTALVTYADGTFADEGVTAWSSTAEFTDLSTIDAIDELWSVLGFSFELTSITENTVTDSTVTIAGSGYVSLEGYEDTLYTWTWTSQADGGTTFSATAVPSPAGAALLGLALLGFGFARRNNNA